MRKIDTTVVLLYITGVQGGLNVTCVLSLCLIRAGDYWHVFENKASISLIGQLAVMAAASLKTEMAPSSHVFPDRVEDDVSWQLQK